MNIVKLCLQSPLGRKNNKASGHGDTARFNDWAPNTGETTITVLSDAFVISELAVKERTFFSTHDRQTKTGTRYKWYNTTRPTVMYLNYWKSSRLAYTHIAR